MRKNNDRMLLESLVRKYGKNSIKNAIKNINESLTHRDYVELEQIVRAIINNNEKLNTLLDSAGNPTSRAQRIISVYDAYVLDVFYELIDAEAVDCEYIVERIGRMAEDNEWEYGTEASMIVNFLTDIADEINVNINESYKINEKSDEDIILDRLSGKDPEPEMTVGLTDESMQYFKDDFYRALNDVAQTWEFRYICPSDDDWFNALKWFLKEFRNRNF